MPRTRWILFAVVVSLVFLAAPDRHGPEAKPPVSGPRLVAVMEADWPGAGCTGYFAVDDRGTVYGSCGHAGPFQVVGSVPGEPVSLTRGVGIFIVGTANGDVYATNPTVQVPWTFRLEGNVLTAGGAR
jgi:hypothetical protein